MDPAGGQNRLLRPFGRLLGAKSVGPRWLPRPLWNRLRGALGAFLGRSRRSLEASWAALGASWAVLGAVRGPPGLNFGLPGASFWNFFVSF